jgi:hypothetical protein
MRLGRIGPLAVAAALGTVALTGCEARKEVFASCSTEPPVPHQSEGVLSVDVHVPLKVAAGSTFTIRVDDVIGYPYLTGPGEFPHGTLSVTGAASPAGLFGVGSGYPQTLTFTATGQPGDTIDVTVENGSSVFGDYPDAFYVATCYATVDIATITLT